MTFTVHLRCDGAAFEGIHCGEEIGNILHTIAARVWDHTETGVRNVIAAEPWLRDTNGNVVGEMEVDK